ncbi:MAG: inner membrane protein [Natronomonas sp.]|jgi:inner membrane protein|uniref:metal-dependent hydrolase n=1 Tax=Natronomonas sp. TaxID=2184060 RepID=UPI0039898057
MHRVGHFGAALLLYAPVGAVLTAGGDPTLALVGFAVAAALSTLPDADEHLTIEHRGPTHTVWFVIGVALLAALSGTLAGLVLARPVAFGTTVGGAAAISLSSHLLADSITPMGIRPFAPASSFHHSFELTLAANPRANAAFFLAGTVAALASQTVAVVLP